MVVESLINPFKAEKKSWETVFIGFLYSSIGIFMSLWIFEKQASFVMVFLTVLACVPVVYNTMRLEEGKDMSIAKESILLKEHNKAIVFLMFLFLGITLSCVLWYVVLPQEFVLDVFSRQIQTITDINNQVSGNATQVGLFTKIFFNNIKVLSFAILFAFIYGAGAIFILTWNATVIGTAIGNFIRSSIGEHAASVGALNIGHYFQIVSLGLMKYAIHGIPEIFAYFYGGLAGGIISVAIIRHHYASKKFMHIMIDSSELIILSLTFLLVAALFEVYVTPLFF